MLVIEFITYDIESIFNMTWYIHLLVKFIQPVCNAVANHLNWLIITGFVGWWLILQQPDIMPEEWRSILMMAYMVVNITCNLINIVISLPEYGCKESDRSRIPLWWGVGWVGMRTIDPWCVVVVVVILHLIVIRSERAFWQPLSCSIIVTRRNWDDRQCWRSRFNVKMLWWCTTQNDGSWLLFDVDEGKFYLPPLRDDGVAEECYTGLKTWWTSTT